MLQSRKKLSPSEIKQRIYRYCAYQERCHKEVKNKLFELGATKSESDELIAELITEGYLNEERFAKAFAGGKFRLKKWGRLKILHELEFKGLTPYCIKSAMREIDEDEYIKTLKEILQKKAAMLDERNPFVKNDRLASYAIQKGFEPEMIWQLLKAKDPF